MRLLILTPLTMIAFASNSLLNRLAVDSGSIDPSSFALIRVLAGAVMLGMLMTQRSTKLPLFDKSRWVGVLSLSAYMIGFSLAYLTLDAGLGALILFGTVQIGMFGWSALNGNRATPRQVAGAALAFIGLALVLVPSDGVPVENGFITGVLFMVLAGIGWAAYTLAGRGAEDPLAATAANFIWSTPLLFVFLASLTSHATVYGAGLAIISGALTSGVGYALWYSLQPNFNAQSAAVIQLSVPVIAILAGALFLGEEIKQMLVISTMLVLGGIAIAITAPAARADRS